MSVQWLSINDVRRLVKQKMYRLETGSKPGDQLVYDRRLRQYVGHIEGGGSYFEQSPHYEPPRYIIEALEDFDGGDWNGGGHGW
jgi:hypothetical protein